MPANHKLRAMLIFLPKVGVAMKHQIYSGGHGQEEGKGPWGKLLMFCLSIEKAEFIQNQTESHKVETQRTREPWLVFSLLLALKASYNFRS